MAAAITRPIWSGNITFGLVCIPVRLYKAVDAENAVALRMMCRTHGVPVKMPKVCSAENHPVTEADFCWGMEIAKGRFVIIEQDEVDGLPVATLRAINVQTFVPASDVLDPVCVKNIYYVGADPVGVQAYAILRDALARTKRAAVAKVALRNGREHLCAIVPHGKQLRLLLLRWPEDIRDNAPLDANIPAGEAETRMAMKVIMSMSSDYTSDTYVNEYKAELLRLAENKAAVVVPTTTPSVDATRSVDLMSALKASVEARRKQQRKSA